MRFRWCHRLYGDLCDFFSLCKIMFRLAQPFLLERFVLCGTLPMALNLRAIGKRQINRLARLPKFAIKRPKEVRHGTKIINLSGLREIVENDDRRISHWRVMAGELKLASFLIHSESSDVVSALVARIEKPTGGIEVEAARIVAVRPFFGDEGQLAMFAHGENRDAVVQAVARINETAICGDFDFGAEIAPGKTRRRWKWSA